MTDISDVIVTSLSKTHISSQVRKCVQLELYLLWTQLTHVASCIYTVSLSILS